MRPHEIRRRKRLKERLFYLTTIVLSVLFLFVAHKMATRDLTLFSQHDPDQDVVKARVSEINDKITENHGSDGSPVIESVLINFEAEILSGGDKGKTVSASQTIDSTLPFYGTTEVKKGDRILLFYSFSEGAETPDPADDQGWLFMEFVRTDKLLGLGILFMLCLLIFGRKKGFNTLLSLVLTCAAIFAVFIPSILSGGNIYAWSVVVCLYTIVVTYLIVNGYSKKTFAACLGCFGGIVVSGLLTLIMDRVLALTGIVDEQSIYLTYIPTENPVDLRAIIFAAIIIGAMGAVMDVAMSISSALWEIREKTGFAPFQDLFRSGMNIGRDVMGTMANTLILAYIGSSLSVVLLLSVYSTSLLYLLNREMIVVEILQALVGSFGILSAIPLTSFICAIIYTKSAKRPSSALR